MKNGLFKNLRLQTYLQVLNTIIPLITTPYIARKIGSDGLGIFSYVTSNAAYFTLFAMLGTENYGTKKVAEIKDDLKLRSKVFWEIYSIQIVSSLLAIAAYLVFFALCEENRVMVLLQMITIVGYLFDISWYFFGIEEFEITVISNIIIRILTLTSIFVFIKSPEDLWLYTVIMLGSASITQFVLWFFIRRRLLFAAPTLKGIAVHIKPNLLLFIPRIALIIFHYVDKTMLGRLSTYDQSGYYYNVDKIIRVPLGVFTGIGTVMLPKMTYLYKTDKGRAKVLLQESFDGVIMLAVAVGFGIYAVAKDFVPWFLGDEYMACIALTEVLAPALIIKGLSNAIRVHYLIPAEKEQVYIGSVVAGAALNILLNGLFIPTKGALGAIIATLVAELLVLIIEALFVIKYVDIIYLLRNTMVYTVLGVVMVLAVKAVGTINMKATFKVCLEVMTGGLTFGILGLIYLKVSGNPLYGLTFGRVIKSKL